jgi:hypothetical protein
MDLWSHMAVQEIKEQHFPDLDNMFWDHSYVPPILRMEALHQLFRRDSNDETSNSVPCESGGTMSEPLVGGGHHRGVLFIVNNTLKLFASYCSIFVLHTCNSLSTVSLDLDPELYSLACNCKLEPCS